MKVRLTLLLGAAAVLAAVTGFPSAAAFPPESTDSICGSSVNYTFTNPSGQPNWSGVTWQADVATGLQQWNGYKDFQGTAMVSAKSTGGGTPVSIYLDTGIGASISARASCTAANKRIRFNPTRINTNGSPTPAIWARWVAAHEMGHIFRMGHTGGLEDTQEASGLLQVMATCNISQRTVRTDDLAALSYFWDDADPQVIADRGGENLSAAAWPANGMSRVFSTEQAKNGSRSIKITPNSVFNQLEQVVNFASPTGSERSLSIGLQRRNLSAATVGNLFVSAYYKEVRYPLSGTCDAGNYATNRNQNLSRTYVSRTGS